MRNCTTVPIGKPADKRRPAESRGHLKACSPACKRRPVGEVCSRHANSFGVRPPETKQAFMFWDKTAFAPLPKKRPPRFAPPQKKSAWAKTIRERRNGTAYNVSARLIKAIERLEAQAERARLKASKAAAPPPPPVSIEEEDEDPEPPQEEDELGQPDHEPDTYDTVAQIGPRLIETRKDRTLTLCAAVGAGISWLLLTMTTVWLFINVLWQQQWAPWLIWQFGSMAIMGSMFFTVRLFVIGVEWRASAAVRKVVTAVLALASFLVVALLYGWVMWWIHGNSNLTGIWMSYVCGMIFVIGYGLLTRSLIFITATTPDRATFSVTVREVVTLTALSAALLVTCMSVLAGFRAGRPVHYRSDAETGGYAVSANIPYLGRSITVPDTHKELPVTKISRFGFRKDPFLKEISLGIHIDEIGQQAFSGCNALERVIFRSAVPPDSVYASAFRVSGSEDAPLLPKMRYYVPADGYEVYRSAWKPEYRWRLVPYGLTDDMFYIRDGVLVYAYGDADEMTVPAPVNAIGAEAFRYSSPRSISLPDTVVRIGYKAFAGQERLSIIKSSSLTPPELEAEVFSETALDTILVPDAAVEAYRAAPGWSQYADRIFGKGWANDAFLTRGDPHADMGDQPIVNVPENVRHIADAAFLNDQTMTEVILPRSLSSIGERAFEGCARLSEVSVPSSVTQVGALAFYDCKALKRASFHGATRFGFDPNRYTGVFTDCEALEEVTLGEGAEQIPI